MSDAVIQVENLGKKFRRGARPAYGRFSELLVNGARAGARWARDRAVGLFARGDNGKAVELGEHEFWALKDVSFEVKRGEVLGIIGRNGAGKSTLLKLLSRITRPTTGEIRLRGRVGSLLEVGTGFHPELTGRENVYLNGTLLGMRKREVDRKFDEIVAFAEIEQFLDTPVKHYSSGMYMRLAFAVAAHLEPEILLVDEVLAVGDAQFQKKCLGKMGEVAKGGRTILFVSHNMAATTRICSRVLCLERGVTVRNGDPEIVTQWYSSQAESAPASVSLVSDPTKRMQLRYISVGSSNQQSGGVLEMGEPIVVTVEYDVNATIKGAHVICFVHTQEGVNVLGCGDADCSPDRLGVRLPGSYRGEFTIPAFVLGEGMYWLDCSLSVPFVHVYDRHDHVVEFRVVDFTSIRRQLQHQRRPGILGLEIPWSVTRLDNVGATAPTST